MIAILASLVLIALGSACAAQTDTTVIPIDGAGTGRIFDGIGALSAGASSRLLIDYPPKQRREILDYLFKPNFGAALQINKVEIGGDANSTDGSEPSHMRTPTDQDSHRGYEWWLMVESKKRNPEVKLYALEWATPNWINPVHNDVWTDNNITYILNWLRHAKSDYGLTMNDIGGWNERGYDKAWYEKFRAALNDNGFSTVKLVGDDSFRWDVDKAIAADPAFSAAVDIIGQHYPDVSPGVAANANYQLGLKSGKAIWLSEMGSAPYDTGAAGLAKTFNLGYLNARATADINWSTIWSVYSGLPYAGCGLMLADTPWSGHYVVGQSIWVVAHTTQFAKPGWQYIDSACGYLGDGHSAGTYVTLKSPNNHDYSVIAETLDAKAPQTASFTVTGSLSTGVVHVWATDLGSRASKDWFVKQADVVPSAGAFTVTLKPGCVYSLTTTTGQTKGMTKVPPTAPFPTPYHETFAEYPLGATPKYFSDQMGTFEVARAKGRPGKCLRQVVSAQPVLWSDNGAPSTLIGDPHWQDYRVRSDVLLEQPGYVDLIGRMMNTSSGNSNNINGYHLRVTDTGQWSLLAKMGEKDTVLASGTTPYSVGTWHTLALTFTRNQISGSIDGKPVFTNLADNTFSQGLVGYQVSKWQNAEFQNLSVTTLTAKAQHFVQPVTATATTANVGYGPKKAVDGNTETFWHTQYEPTQATLPQSITVDLGKVISIDAVRYTPRQDSIGNGIITSYQIETSTDGTGFTFAAKGPWPDGKDRKFAFFAVRKARYVRLTALEGVGGFASAAEIAVEEAAP